MIPTLLFLLFATGAGSSQTFDAIKTRGDPIYLSWTLPTQYTDNSSLDQSKIAYVTITWACDTQVADSKNVPGPATKYTLIDASIYGQCGFVVKVTMGTGAKYPGTTSGPSVTRHVLIRLKKSTGGGLR